MKIEDIAIDASKYYRRQYRKAKINSILRKMFPKYFERKINKAIKAMEE